MASDQNSLPTYRYCRVSRKLSEPHDREVRIRFHCTAIRRKMQELIIFEITIFTKARIHQKQIGLGSAPE